MLLKDIRDYQILFLGLFLVVGIGTRDWTLRPELIGVAIATSLATQWILSLVTGKEQMTNLRSALITSLGLSLLLRADHWTTMAIAAAIAIASKFIFQVGDKHFFNPANFGIISALILTPDAWVSPGQWGEEWWYGLLFAGTGGMILQRVGRWDTTAAFLGSYSLLEAIRNLWLGWTWDVYWHRLMSGSLLLFALFMITDPRSIPNSRIGRVVWAVCIAGLTFILRNYFFVSTAVFWALFALAPLTILLDILWVAPRFAWQEGDEGAGEAGGELLTPNSCTDTINRISPNSCTDTINRISPNSCTDTINRVSPNSCTDAINRVSPNSCTDAINRVSLNSALKK